MRNIVKTIVVFSVLLAPLSADCIQQSGDGSIDSLEKITLGGVVQWILIQSNDVANPVLLVLHGGPGYAMMPLLHENNGELEDHFIVVNWDQRGAGKSYSPDIPEESMTLEQFVSDAHELTEVLKARFDQERIYLMGHSLGTVLGMLLIEAYPDDYFGFVGVGQVVDVIENEQLSYDFALSEAQADENTEAIEALNEIGRPDEDGWYSDDSGYDVTMEWVGYYGGDLVGKTSTEEIEDAILNSEIYAEDGEKIENGWAFSQTIFSDEALWYLDFRTQVTQVDVPVYFFTGRHDYDTPFELVEEYYDVLDAPIKEIVWFEHSAHFPFYEEPARFDEMMIEKVLAETQPQTAVLEERTPTLPEQFTLDQNYPNPFNSGTVIRFALPASEEIELSVFDLMGQKVAALASGRRQAGTYTVHWDGRDDSGSKLASGAYVYRMQTGVEAETRKLLLLR